MHFRALTLLLVAASAALPCLAASLRDCEKGEALAIARSYAPARDLLDACLVLDVLSVTQRSRFLKARAWSNLQLGNAVLALADQELAFATRGPETKLDLINYAYILRANRSYDKALVVLRMLQAKEVEANTVSMQTQYQLGWTLREMGSHTEAVAQLLLAVPSQPEFPYVHWQLALAYEALGDTKGAEHQLREFRRKCVGEWRPTNQMSEIAIFRSKLAAYGLAEGLDW